MKTKEKDLLKELVESYQRTVENLKLQHTQSRNEMRAGIESLRAHNSRLVEALKDLSDLCERAWGTAIIGRTIRNKALRVLSSPATPEPEAQEPTIESFNKIADIRIYLLNHPDKEMIRASCLHYLGDRFQEFASSPEPEEKPELSGNPGQLAEDGAGDVIEQACTQCGMPKTGHPETCSIAVDQRESQEETEGLAREVISTVIMFDRKSNQEFDSEDERLRLTIHAVIKIFNQFTITRK